MRPIEKCVVHPPERVIRLEIPVGKSPLGSCQRQTTPVDLQTLGYVEEEYIIQGKSNVYLWPEDKDRPQIQIEDAPYSTRVLIYKPEDPKRFSGVVVMENFNNSARIDMSKVGWTICYEELAAQGDAWVGYDVQKVGFRLLETFDPERYSPYHLAFDNPLPPEERGPLGWHILRQEFARLGITPALEVPDDFEKGLMFDMSYQLAALCRRCAEGDPFDGYAVTHICGAAVADYNLYVAGFEPYLHRENGKPMFDGFLKVMSGSGGEISREADMWQCDDPRSMVYSEVPFIKIETAGDMRSIMPHPSMACKRRMTDRNEEGQKAWWYELAGVAVKFTERYDVVACACEADYRQLDLERPCTDSGTPYPNYSGIRLIEAAYHNLREWMLHGITPPHMEDYLELHGEYPNVEFDLDSNGNHIGGVRSSYVDVPVASYLDDGRVEMFSPEKLDALYGTPEAYAAKVDEYLAQMVSDRWLLPRGAQQISNQAHAFSWKKEDAEK